MGYFGRNKNKIQNPRNLSDMYVDYIKDKDPLYSIDFKTFYNICDIFYKEVIEQILKGQVFNMPFGLGNIQISKRKITVYKKAQSAVNWEETLKTGIKVWHLNEHSDGYNYGIDWNYGRSLKYVRGYKFVPTRTFKRTLAKLIKTKEQDYYERENKIS